MQSVKTFLVALLLSLPAQAVTVRTVVIDHTKVGASDQSQPFTFPVAGTYSYLATVANGGSVQNANGYDVEFWADAAMTTKLHWEVELYTASTGQVVYWVQVPSVSHTADTTIYLSYGDSSVTTDQSNKTGTWNANYSGVYHLQQTAGPYLDSTSLAINSTGGTSPTAVSSTLFAGTNAQSVSHASGGAISFSNFPLSQSAHTDQNWTASGWFKDSAAQSYNQAIWDYRGLSGVSGPVLYLDTLCHINFFMGPSGVGYTGSVNLCDGNWHHYVATGLYTLYVDGVNVLSSTGITLNQGSGRGGYFGQAYDGAGSVFNGQLQEFQFQDTYAATADWVTATYNSQKSPSTFYSIGTPAATAVARHKLIRN